MSSRLTSMEEKLSRRRVLAKLALPVLFCVVGASYLLTGGDGRSEEARTFFNPDRGLAEGRRLQEYDTTVSSLPAWTATYANVWDPILPSDTPTMWFEAKGGGSTINYIFAHCLGLVIANHQSPISAVNNATLGVWEVGNQGIWPNVRQIVNVRTNTISGLAAAKSRGLLESGLADVIFTPYITYAGESFFSGSYRARGFAMMRHPEKRVEDQFFYRQHATWEGSFDVGMATMSLAEFAASDKLIENFEVRTLLKMDATTAITGADVILAKEILRQKFIVGIFEWFDVSIVRFERYFGWFDDKDVLGNLTINWCHFKMIDVMDQVGNYPKVPTSEAIADMVTTRMWADVELYHYAKGLYNEQAALLGTV